MHGPQMGNYEWLMRAYRQAAEQQQRAQNLYFTGGERAAEDVTGLRLLEEFLEQRRQQRKGE